MKAPDDRESVLARFLEGPALLERALAGVQDAELDAHPSHGGWTIRQILHHIVDGDDIWKIGIKVALGNEHAEFSLDWYRTQPQEVWAENWAYANRPLDEALTLLRASRHHVCDLVLQVPDGWHRSVGFRTPDGEIERLPVGAIVEMQADHVEHHVKQIRASRSEVDGVSGRPLSRFPDSDGTLVPPSRNRLPENTSLVMPRLVCRDAAAEMEFCLRTFEAEELNRRADPDGTVAHCLLTISGEMIMVEGEWPSLPSRAPAPDASSPVVIFVYVPDVDATVQRAEANGARVLASAGPPRGRMV